MGSSMGKKPSKKLSQADAERLVLNAFPHAKISRKAVSDVPAPDNVARADAQLPANKTIASKYQSNHVIADGDAAETTDADNDYTGVNLVQSDDTGVTKTRQVLVNNDGDMILEG